MREKTSSNDAYAMGTGGELPAKTQILSEQKPAGVRKTRLVGELQPR